MTYSTTFILTEGGSGEIRFGSAVKAYAAFDLAVEWGSGVVELYSERQNEDDASEGSWRRLLSWYTNERGHEGYHNALDYLDEWNGARR